MDINYDVPRPTGQKFPKLEHVKDMDSYVTSQAITEYVAQSMEKLQVTPENQKNWRETAWNFAEQVGNNIAPAGLAEVTGQVAMVEALEAACLKLGQKWKQPAPEVFVDGKKTEAPFASHEYSIPQFNTENFGQPDKYTSGVEYTIPGGYNITPELFKKIFINGETRLEFETFDETPAKGFSGSQQRYDVHHTGPKKGADAWCMSTSYGNFTGGSGSTRSLRLVQPQASIKSGQQQK